MYQIDNSTAAASQPAATSAGTAGFFTDGNPATGTPATIVPAEWLNAVMMELVNVVTAGGLTPTKNVFNQVASAIKGMRGTYNGSLPLSASSTLTVAQVGAAVYFYGSTASQTLTLPSASSLSPGQGYTFSNYAAVPVTVARAGGDTILAGSGVSSIVLQPGDDLEIAAANASQWVAIGSAVRKFNPLVVAPATQSLHAVNQGQTFGVNGTYSAPGRSVGTTYTNSSGRPIAVYVYGVTSSPNGYVAMSINGSPTLVTSQPTNASGVGFMAIIPPGATYSVTVQTVTLTSWNEFS